MVVVVVCGLEAILSSLLSLSLSLSPRLESTSNG